jgi:hypothetical protein
MRGSDGRCRNLHLTNNICGQGALFILENCSQFPNVSPSVRHSQQLVWSINVSLRIWILMLFLVARWT